MQPRSSRELKAVGGDLKCTSAWRSPERERGPELGAVIAALPRDELCSLSRLD